MGKSIIIGSNGYLGKNLAYYLKNKGEELYCYDLQSTSIDNVECYEKLDITNKIELEKLNLNVNYVYLFAGLTGTSQGFYNYDSYVDVNEKGLLNILDKMKNDNSKARIIFPSTRLVYKGQSGVLLNENAHKQPKTIYAVNKLTSEYILSVYKNAFDIDFTVFRICVPYGQFVKGEYSYGTIGFFIQNAMEGNYIPLYGDGGQKRTFTHIQDICDKIYLAIYNEESIANIYNIGGENLSLLDVAKKIAGKFNVIVKFEEWPELAKKIESGDTIFDGGLLDQISYPGIKVSIDDWLG